MCYCKQARNLTDVELQCMNCLKWFHRHCIVSHVGLSIQFSTNYQFSCRHCNGPTQTEAFSRKRASYSQMCVAVLANLTFQNKARTKFSVRDEIIPFVENNWEKLTTAPRRQKSNLYGALESVLVKDTHLFVCEHNDVGDLTAGLVSSDLLAISPYDEPRTALKRKNTPIDSLAASSKTKTIASKLSADGHPLDYPANKDNYRYHLAEIDPYAPGRLEFEESHETSGKVIPGYYYRRFQGSLVLLSLTDRAQQLKLSDNRLAVTGEKGYSMVRATHSVHSGRWYFEVTIDSMPNGSAARIGWSQKLANMQAPCGFDQFSYSWRSRKGTVFHESKGRHYAESGYGQGDVIGCYISLPAGLRLFETTKEMPLIKFKNHFYFEEKDDVQAAVKSLEPLAGSSIAFFRNGNCLGAAFRNVYGGDYFPAISLFKNATVSVNFGPKFQFAPKLPAGCRLRPMSEAVSQETISNILSDLVYIVSNERKFFDFS